MRIQALPLVLTFFVASAAVTAQTQPRVETGFLNRSLTFGGQTYKYQIFVPPSYTPHERWPVILFLHGAGERGSDGFMQTQVGLASAIRQNASRFAAIAVFPQ